MVDTTGSAWGKRKTESPLEERPAKVTLQSVSSDDNQIDENGDEDGDEEDEEDDEEDNEYYEDEFDEMDMDEDQEEPEYEVEETTYTISGDPEAEINLRIHISKDEEFQTWLSTVHIRCTLDGNEIGYGLGRYIRRERIKATFWRDMEEPSQDMADLAFEVFDKYGFLKKNFQDHCIKKGTGVWGSELNFGPLFLIESIEIDKAWRQKGLGREMVSALIEKAKKQDSPKTLTAKDRAFQEIMYGKRDLGKYSRLHILAIPGWLRKDVESETEGKSTHEKREVHFRAADSASAFYRSLGFRRVGTSFCFGLSLDPNHKSHGVAPVDDTNPPTEIPEETSDNDDDPSHIFTPRASPSIYPIYPKFPAFTERKLERLKQRLPLHHATITLSDIECVKYYQTFTAKDNVEWTKAYRSGDRLTSSSCSTQFKAAERKMAARKCHDISFGS